MDIHKAPLLTFDRQMVRMATEMCIQEKGQEYEV